MLHQLSLIILLLVEELLLLLLLLSLLGLLTGNVHLLIFKIGMGHHMGVSIHALGHLRGHRNRVAKHLHVLCAIWRPRVHMTALLVEELGLSVYIMGLGSRNWTRSGVLRRGHLGILLVGDHIAAIVVLNLNGCLLYSDIACVRREEGVGLATLFNFFVLNKRGENLRLVKFRIRMIRVKVKLLLAVELAADSN